MAVDSDNMLNGIIIKGSKVSFDNALNTAPDQTSISIQTNVTRQFAEVKPVEIERSKGTTAAKITFTQTVEQNAETWFIHLRYFIFKNP